MRVQPVARTEIATTLGASSSIESGRRRCARVEGAWSSQDGGYDHDSALGLLALGDGGDPSMAVMAS